MSMIRTMLTFRKRNIKKTKSHQEKRRRIIRELKMEKKRFGDATRSSMTTTRINGVMASTPMFLLLEKKALNLQ